MKRTFRKGQKVRSIYDPKHVFTIDASYMPDRLFHEKDTDRWWQRSELQAIREAEKAERPSPRSGKRPQDTMRPDALRAMFARALVKAAPAKSLPPKKCELSTCQVFFAPKRKWQRFCCDEHKREWNKLQAVAS